MRDEARALSGATPANVELVCVGGVTLAIALAELVTHLRTLAQNNAEKAAKENERRKSEHVKVAGLLGGL